MVNMCLKVGLSNMYVYIIKVLLGRCKNDFDGLTQDCSNSNAPAMELLQSCAKPSIKLSNVGASRLISETNLDHKPLYAAMNPYRASIH